MLYTNAATFGITKTFKNVFDAGLNDATFIAKLIIGGVATIACLICIARAVMIFAGKSSSPHKDAFKYVGYAVLAGVIAAATVIVPKITDSINKDVKSFNLNYVATMLPMSYMYYKYKIKSKIKQ